ncbi:MAG: DUF5814 domain-containing protein [Halobacteria archaeon]|nr:DUF5814 domain-containing protein [Halobacteria archaeon]
MAITDRIYLKDANAISSQIDRRMPRNIFSGAALDILYSTEALESLDPGTRDQLLEFVEEFLDCGCKDAPYCGHPEEKFMKYLLELRSAGLSPDEIVETMEAEYGLYAYTGDILDFLDSAVRNLEAFEKIAGAAGKDGVKSRSERLRRDLVE